MPPTFDFSEALKYLKAGEPVARTGWHGRPMHIYLEEAHPWVIPGGVFKGHRREYRACLCLVLPDGSHQPGWLASQTDLLAEDWHLVDPHRDAPDALRDGV